MKSLVNGARNTEAGQVGTDDIGFVIDLIIEFITNLMRHYIVLLDRFSFTKKLMLFTRWGKPQLPWWIEIRTKIPSCTYYFGPFDRLKEAKLSQHGYIEDLVEEKAQGITVELKRCQPQMLTIEEE